MDGVLIIDKPAGMTSHDVVARVRREFGTKRVGHTGTLDPFATGILVVLLGKATRLARFLDGDSKEYLAVVQFGSETDTGDRTGLPKAETVRSKDEFIATLSGIDWQHLLSKFMGELLQIPPMYSAKKIAGEKLYKLARRGDEIERRPVNIKVHDLAIVDDAELADKGRLTLRVVCSAGTYVRTLAEDIGREIGIGAHLAELRRTTAGKFDLRDSSTLDELTADKVLPVDSAVSQLSELILAEDRIEKTKSGLGTRVGDTRFTDGEFIRMTDSNGSLIAIGVYHPPDQSVKPKIVLV